MQYKAEPPEEGLVNVVNEVSGEDDDAREALDVVEEHSHVHISIAVRGGAGEGEGGGGGMGDKRGKGEGKRERGRGGWEEWEE